MNEIVLKGLDEVIYHEELLCGLNVYIWNNKHAHSFQGKLCVFYGAEDLEFSISKKNYNLVTGSAHYLEHVMCENVSGEPILTLFNKLGSHSNAVTSSNKTVYEFTGSVNLKENIKLLLDTVFDKEFDSKMVEHERTPILEEARMRCDKPGIMAHFKLNEMLFNNYPNQRDLIGNKEEIESISLEDLRFIYNSFYHPKNMALVLTGDFNPYEIMNYVKEEMGKRTFKEFIKPKIKKYREPKRVSIKKDILKCNVSSKELIVRYKIPLQAFSIPKDILLIYLRIILSCNLGNTSLFKEELLEKKLITSLYFSCYDVYDYIIVEVGAVTNYLEELEKIIINKMNNLELNEEDILRKRKMDIATLVLGYEDPVDVNSFIVSSLARFNKIITDEKEQLESINKENLSALLKSINLQNYSVLYMLPNKKEG